MSTSVVRYKGNDYSVPVRYGHQALLLDASVIVNLNATGYAYRILSALPAEILIPRLVLIELRNGAAAGHTDAVDLQELLNLSLIHI